MKSGGIFKTNTSKGTEATPLSSVLFSALLASMCTGFLVPTPTLAGLDKKVSEICKKSTDAAFRAKYCSAAKDLREGYNANIATSAVWTGVSVACGAVCGKAAGSLACKVANMGGSAGESVLTKKFSDSIAGESLKWTGGTSDGADAPTAIASNAKVNADACEVAGKSALKAYGKFSDSKQNDKSLSDLRDQTKELNTPTGQKPLIFNAGDTQYSGDTNGPSTFAASTGASEICGDAAIKTALGAIRCAASADPNLPGYVKSESFVKDLQRATGKSPDEFFAAFESPAKSIFDSPIVNGLSEAQQHGLADSLSAMEGYSDSKSAKVAATSPGTGSVGYAAKGAGKISHDDETGFDMNGMIANVLGQMGGAADGENAAANTTGQIAIAREPAAVSLGAAEDRKLSIFDRVKFRYGAISARDRLGAP